MNEAGGQGQVGAADSSVYRAICGRGGAWSCHLSPHNHPAGCRWDGGLALDAAMSV